VVDGSAKITRVTGCGSVDTTNRSFEDAIEEVKEKTGFSGGACLVTFGAEFFSFRNVSLPFSDRSKIAQALPFELVDHSPVDISSLLIDFIVAKTGKEKTDIVAAMISREELATYLSVLHAAGINPRSIGISGFSSALVIAEGLAENFLLIDIGTRWASLFVVRDRQVTLVRSLALFPEIAGRTELDSVFVQNVKQTVQALRLLHTDNSNFKTYLTGSELLMQNASAVLPPVLDGVTINVFRASDQPLTKIEPEIQGLYQPELMDRILTHVLKDGKKSGGFNFRKDDFRKKKSLREYRELLLKIALPLSLFIVSAIGYAAYTYSTLSVEQERIRQAITDVFQETLPEVTRIVNPVQQLQVKNNEIKATYRPSGASGAGSTVVELLAELSARIPEKYAVKVVRLVADMDTIRMKAVTGDFNTVDNVQKDLARSPYFSEVVISSANQSTQGDEVNFELKLELAGK
jgi:type II secretory pathway component PulL